MAQSLMKITRESGSKEYPVLPATIVAFEAEFAHGVADGLTMTEFFWIAWKAEYVVEKKAGSVVKLFDDWLEDILDVEEIDSPKRPTGGRSRSSSQP